MINRTFPEFWRRYYRLPAGAQEQAREAFRVFRSHPSRSSLRFKPLKAHADVWSVRVGLHYRAVALRRGNTLRWFWIGTHAEFDKEFS